MGVGLRIVVGTLACLCFGTPYTTVAADRRVESNKVRPHNFPAIHEICPPVLPPIGGDTPVIVFGANLSGSAASIVTDDGISHVVEVTVVCDETIIVDCPPIPPGEVTLHVENEFGSCTAGFTIRLADDFSCLEMIACLIHGIEQGLHTGCIDNEDHAESLAGKLGRAGEWLTKNEPRKALQSIDVFLTLLQNFRGDQVEPVFADAFTFLTTHVLIPCIQDQRCPPPKFTDSMTIGVGDNNTSRFFMVVDIAVDGDKATLQFSLKPPEQRGFYPKARDAKLIDPPTITLERCGHLNLCKEAGICVFFYYPKSDTPDTALAIRYEATNINGDKELGMYCGAPFIGVICPCEGNQPDPDATFVQLVKEQVSQDLGQGFDYRVDQVGTTGAADYPKSSKKADPRYSTIRDVKEGKGDRCRFMFDFPALDRTILATSNQLPAAQFKVDEFRTYALSGAGQGSRAVRASVSWKLRVDISMDKAPNQGGNWVCKVTQLECKDATKDGLPDQLYKDKIGEFFAGQDLGQGERAAARRKFGLPE